MVVRIVEKIEADLEGLILGFMEITRREIKELSIALESGDMTTAARLGHNIKGSALNYGFLQLGGIGRRIESCAAQNDLIQVRAEFNALKDYVERVEVEFV
ncbi:Hpt domain-containing protein [Desulfovibrio sp. JC010]|uniref:Hpt domain-containing protein n=1 Tax=Desulfovibrio sp. JC010 TaxID=2593641 RepID=UPI0013D61984|nr:Hpt domain-containing protein [Desulfovibrio sp. JC010]NDV27303.1 Hpt domain-containing protein [Desulfovibrio sp. JC010]